MTREGEKEDNRKVQMTIIFLVRLCEYKENNTKKEKK